VNPVLRSEIGPVTRIYFDVVDEVIERGIASGRFQFSGTPRLARQLVFGSLDAVVTSWALSGAETPLLPEAAPLVEMLTRALSPSS
jgi:TetR/AcrR family fatty acid metabolism transcriptional regulator